MASRTDRCLSRWLRFVVASALGVLLAGSAAHAQQSGKPRPAAQEASAGEARPEGDRPLERMEWFYQQRAFPLKEIPPGMRLRAVQHLEEMLRRERERGLLQAEAVEASPTMWTLIGPQPTNSPPFAVSGRIGGLAVDPTDANIVYLGGAQGGVWKTTNGGQTWLPLSDDLPSLAVGSLAIDPSSCNPAPCRTIYAGTGEQTFSTSSYYGAGVLKSTDGGLTWRQLGNPPGAPFVGPFSSGRLGGAAFIGSIAVSPAQPGVVLAGVSFFLGGPASGIYRSTDGGETWTVVLSGAAGTEVVFASGDGMLVYASLGDVFADANNGVYKSTDGGLTWTKLIGTNPNSFPAQDVGRVEIAVAPSDPNTIYAGIQDASSASFGALLGFFKSTDGGLNWMRLSATPDYCTPQCWYDHVIRVHPTNPSIVFAGGAAQTFNNAPSWVLRSLDGGNTWQGIARTGTSGPFLHVDTHAFAFSNPASGPLKLYVGNDGGVWSTTNIEDPPSAITWTNLNETLALTQFYPGNSIHPSSADIGLGGTQDNSTQKYTGTTRWNVVTCGDGAWTAFDPLMPSTAYSNCQRIEVRRSFHIGADPPAFSRAHLGINTSDRVEFIPPLVHDPNFSGRLYFGTFRVWQTTNHADFWTAISPDLTGGTRAITTIAVAPSNSDVVFAGTFSGRVQKTSNATAGVGATWTDLSAGLPGRVVTRVAVDPADPNVVFTTFSGFSDRLGTCPACADSSGHVFRSNVGGGSWQDITGNLPEVPVNDIVIDPDVANTVYVATDVGVFFTTEAHSLSPNWQTLMTGLPRVAVLSLRLHRHSRVLRAGTHGRSAWDLRLDNFVPLFNIHTLAPTTASATAGPGNPMPLRVRGHGFMAGGCGVGSCVRWEGSPRQTRFVNDKELEADIPLSDLSGGKVVPITVEQSPGGAVSNALPFTVTVASPSLASLSPSSAAAGSPAFDLTVNGSSFTTQTVVRWNGQDRMTTFVSTSQLRARISAADVAAQATIPVRVFNPLPGAGASNSVNFSVTVALAPFNDNFVNAAPILLTPFASTVNSVGATTEINDPAPGCVAGAPGLVNDGRAKSVWYRFTPTGNGTINVDTLGSTYDTILLAVTGEPGGFVEVGCNDDGELGSLEHSQILNLPVTAGITYHFMVTDYEGVGGSTTFNLTASLVPPYTLASNPDSVTISAGQTAEYTLTITPQAGGFAGAIALNCAGLPSLSSCAFNPPSVTLDTQAVEVRLRISTTAPALAPPAPQAGEPLWLRYLMWLALPLLLASLWLLRRKKKLAAAAAMLLLMAVLALHQMGCGGGGGGGGRPGTPPGTYTIVVSAISGAIQQTLNLTLTVR